MTAVMEERLGWRARFVDHVYRHPWRLASIVLATVALGWFMAAAALFVTVDDARQGRVENCRSINELRRQIFVTAVDLGVSVAQAHRFLPTADCEDLP